MKIISALGVGSNLGYPGGHSQRAVYELMQSECRASLARAGLNLNWQLLGSPPKPGQMTMARESIEAQLAHINRQLAAQTHRLVSARQPFLVLGGDHSLAMGTWSGAIQAWRERSTGQAKPFGLLWIDAHLDAHNFNTSPSRNIHGMPLRALLDKTDRKLRQLCPQSGQLCGKNLQLLGIRNYEAREKKFMDDQQATITYMHQLSANNCSPALLQALGTLSKRCGSIGISLDIDAIDPHDAPGVATPEPAGIQLQSLCKAFTHARLFDKVVGLEICEYDPAADTQHRTRNALLKLIKAFYS